MDDPLDLYNGNYSSSRLVGVHKSKLKSTITGGRYVKTKSQTPGWGLASFYIFKIPLGKHFLRNESLTKLFTLYADYGFSTQLPSMAVWLPCLFLPMTIGPGFSTLSCLPLTSYKRLTLPWFSPVTCLLHINVGLVVPAPITINPDLVIILSLWSGIFYIGWFRCNITTKTGGEYHSYSC